MKTKKMFVPVLIGLFAVTVFTATTKLYAQKSQGVDMDRSIQV